MFFAYVQKSRDIYIVYIGVGKIRVASDAPPLRYRCATVALRILPFAAYLFEHFTRCVIHSASTDDVDVVVNEYFVNFCTLYIVTLYIFNASGYFHNRRCTDNEARCCISGLSREYVRILIIDKG